MSKNDVVSMPGGVDDDKVTFRQGKPGGGEMVVTVADCERWVNSVKYWRSAHFDVLKKWIDARKLLRMALVVVEGVAAQHKGMAQFNRDKDDAIEWDKKAKDLRKLVKDIKEVIK